MQGKLIAVAYTLHTHWNQFSLGGICSFSIQGGWNHYILIYHIIVSYDQNILLNFYVKDRSHVRLRHPSCVYIPPRDRTLQYKRCVHLWNNFPCIITLVLPKEGRHTTPFFFQNSTLFCPSTPCLALFKFFFKYFKLFH